MGGGRRPSLAELAARVLREAETSVEASDDRDAHLALLARTLREERGRVSRRRWAGGSLALAAALAAAFGLRSLARDEATAADGQAGAATVSASYDVRVEGNEAEVRRRSGARATPSSPLEVGDSVHAHAAGVTLSVATGTRLTLDPGSALAVAEHGPTQVFALEIGSVRADVAKLHAGERFLVRTADTEVEVRGTSFRVERVEPSACRPDLRTRVVVAEGVVAVRSAGVEARVAAGEQWPPPCATPASPGGPTSALPEPSPVPSAQPAGIGSRATAPSATAPASKLAAANELFAKAEAARKSGDARGAVVLFDRLLVEHPSSPIAEHATVERMRALDQFDRDRAVTAAREYLARYPRGFARAEAEAIVAISP